jgi:hypothetical protein
MPASPLTAALLGGNETNALGLDPSMLQANADIQLGQGMQQTGLSTAPAYLPQALGRLAEVLSGTYVQHQGLSELGKAMSGSVEAIKKIYGEDTPMGKLARSDIPLLQMQAVQNAGKVALLNSNFEKMSPAEQGYRGGETKPTIQGSPALAGAAAGAEAKARAPYESGGDVVIPSPEGPKIIPANAATRAAMQPNARPSGLSVPPSPTGAIPPPEPKQQPPSAPNNTPQGALPKDQSRVPAQGAIPGVSGKPLPNPAIEPAVKADTEEVAKDREAALKGQQEMATIRAIQDFAPKVKTGWSADTKLEDARILKSMGVPDDQIKGFLNTDVAAGQILQKKFVELSAAAARNMGAREPGSVISMFAKAYPNLGTDPQAIQLQTNALYMDRLRSQHLAEQKTNYLNDSINGVQGTGQYRGLKGFNEAFNKSHPAEHYLHAAEAMSGMPEAWSVKDPTNRIPNVTIGFIPPGMKYLGPDGKMHIKPGAAQQ